MLLELEAKYSLIFIFRTLLNASDSLDTLIAMLGRKQMTMATDYRKRADECLEIAQTARTPAQRTMLLHIAETWLNLARDADGDLPPDAANRNVRQGSSLN